MSRFTIDLNSPERAWEPFMDWLRSQRLDPRGLRSITIDPDTMTFAATVMKRRDGKFYVDLNTDDVATEVRSGVITSLPPRRDAQSRTSA